MSDARDDFEAASEAVYWHRFPIEWHGKPPPVRFYDTLDLIDAILDEANKPDEYRQILGPCRTKPW